MIAPTLISPSDLIAMPECPELFETLASAHRLRLLRLAYRITGSWEDAEDVVQETMYSSITESHQFEGRAQFTSWLTRIAINEALSCLRRRKHGRLVSIDDNDEDRPTVELPDTRLTPEAIHISNEMSELLQSRVNRLPLLYRDVLVLYHQQEHSIGEIAEKLSLRESTVKSRLVRARRLLREYLHKPIRVARAS
jgi:RNA polymerase sigma-70 factor (ECF subfamily)